MTVFLATGTLSKNRSATWLANRSLLESNVAVDAALASSNSGDDNIMNSIGSVKLLFFSWTYAKFWDFVTDSGDRNDQGQDSVSGIRR